MNYYQELFDHMYDQHGVTLLESEMSDIIDVVDKMKRTPKKNKLRYFNRVLAVTFVCALYLITAIVNAIRLSINFIKHGGEWIAYTEKTCPQSFNEIINELTDKHQ